MVAGKKKIARRDFLTSVGRALGSATMLRTMAAMGVGTATAACSSSSAGTDGVAVTPPLPGPGPTPAQQSPRPGDWNTSTGTGKSVAILGAGIAGMTAALEMRKLGYTCTVLEALPFAGGRNRTIRAGDVIEETDSVQTCTFNNDDNLYFNAGPARIAPHHEFLLAYCREFGVPLETFTNDNRGAWMHSTSSFGGQPQVARRVRTDTRGNIASLLASAVNQNALDQQLSATDKVNILAMLKRYGDLTNTYAYTGSERAGFPGQENTGSRQRGELLPPLSFSNLLAEPLMQVWQDFAESLEQQPTMLQPVGGMDQIARAFEAEVATEIIYEAVVSEIRNTAGGAQVVYQDRFGATTMLDVDHCICTIPATVLRSIANNFSASHQAAISSFTYSSAGKIAFQSRRFWEQEHNIYGGISWTNQDITQMWYPNAGLGQANGVLVGAYMFGGTAGNNFAAQTPAQRINTSTQQGNNVHAEYGAEVTHGISIAWPKVPFQLGAWGTSDPGVLLSADNNIYFAGEHLSILQGWQEGAILSAYHAIDLVVIADTL
jgi:monoamine oxidase